MRMQIRRIHLNTVRRFMIGRVKLMTGLILGMGKIRY